MRAYDLMFGYHKGAKCIMCKYDPNTLKYDPNTLVDYLGMIQYSECFSLCATYNMTQLINVIKSLAIVVAALEGAREIPYGKKVLKFKGAKDSTSLGTKLFQSLNALVKNSPQLSPAVKNAITNIAKWAKTSGTGKSVARRQALRMLKGAGVAALSATVFVEGWCAGECCHSSSREKYEDVMATSPEDFMLGLEKVFLGADDD